MGFSKKWNQINSKKTMTACDDLNEMSPISLRPLNTWSPVGGTVREGWGGITSLEEVRHCGQAWCFKSLLPSLVLSLLFVNLDVSSHLLLQHHVCLPAATLPALFVMNSYLSGTLNFKQTLLEVVLIMLFYHSKRKVRKTQPMPTTAIRLEEKHSG